MRVTVSTLDKRRRTPAQITELARLHITGRALVTNDPDVLHNAFFMILAFISIDPDAAPHIGAVIGYYDNAVTGRAMNGYPIFTGMDFVHADDLTAFLNEIDRMNKALSHPTESE